LAFIFITKPTKASAMIKFSTRIGLYAMTFVALLTVNPIAANAASQNKNGDGSGIGGTGNSPTGSGFGGTGTREQNSPTAMPDRPDLPETVETPTVEPPELPNVDTGGANVSPPDSLPDTTPAATPQR